MHGEGGAGFRVGQPVATLTYGGFSEFAVERARFVVPVPQASAAVVSFLTSGLTASVSLDEARPQRGETALVTAAAGGTGLFAVQLLKLAGLHVIGTCSSKEKVQLLTRLGVDRVVNYRAEDLKKVCELWINPGLLFATTLRHWCFANISQDRPNGTGTWMCMFMRARRL